MAKQRLPLWNNPQKFATVETDATIGAVVGQNLFFADGTLVTEADFTPDTSGDARVIWKYILEIPPNVSALETAVGTGLFAVTGTGTGAFRTLQGPQSVKVTFGSGVGGDPVLALDGDVTSPGSLFGYGSNMAGVKGWYRPALFESTGLLDGGTLSINAGDNTKFDVSAAVVGYTDYTTNPAAPTRAVAIYGPTSANAVANLAVIATYVGIQTPGSTLVQQSSPFTPTQRRTIVPLGAVISNGANLIAVNNLPDVMRAGINQIQDFMEAVGPIKKPGGNVVTPNGANLQINKSAGVIFKQGANFQTNEDDPHNLALAALTAANFNYRTSTGVQAATTNAINVTQYESPLGTLATVPNNRFTIQRIYVFASNLVRIQYGQTVYQTMAEAESLLATEVFATEQNIADNGVLLAFLIVEKNATALNNPAQAKFIPASKFGGVVGSGGTSITNTDALPEGAVNLYFTNERAQDAVGSSLVDSASIDFTYDDVANTITAIVAAAYDALLVKLAGTQTITGQKTFSQPVFCQTAVSPAYFQATSPAGIQSVISSNDGLGVGFFGTISNHDLSFVANSGRYVILDKAGTRLYPFLNNTTSLGDNSSRWATTYSQNYAVGSNSASFGGGSGVMFFSTATTVPTSNPVGGSLVYSEAGAMKARGASGTITTFGPANPHCPECGSDFVHEWENESRGYGYLAVCMLCYAGGKNSHTRVKGAWNED